MLKKQINRRGLLALLGGSMMGAGLAAFLTPQPIGAIAGVKAWWSKSPSNLSHEAHVLRTLLALRDHPDFRSGSMVGNNPAGCRHGWYVLEEIKRKEALFGVPARCADDVLRKYSMFEEMQWRGFRHYATKFASSKKQHNKLFGHWYVQLEKDTQKFAVDINPWWQEQTPPYAMINGQHMIWNDDHWEPFVPPKEVLALLKDRKLDVGVM